MSTRYDADSASMGFRSSDELAAWQREQSRASLAKPQPVGGALPWTQKTALEKAPSIIMQLEVAAERFTRYSHDSIDGLLQESADALRALSASQPAEAVSDEQIDAIDLRTIHHHKAGGDWLRAYARKVLALAATPVAAQPAAAEPVAWSLRFPEDPRLNLSTVFDTKQEAEAWATKCGNSLDIVVPLYEAAPAQPAPEPASEAAAVPSWTAIADAIAERFVAHPDNRLDLCNAVLDAMRLATQAQAAAVPEAVEHKATLHETPYSRQLAKERKEQS